MNIQTVRRSLGPVLIVAVLATLAGCGKEQQPVAPLEVKVVEVIQKDVPVYKEWVGQTFGELDIEIRARVPGWLEGLHFREGSEVHKGDLLYTIDQTELQQRVAEAQARVAQATTMLARLQADVDRYEPLATAGAVSQRQLEISVAERNARRDEVAAAEAALKIAETSLGYATIRAPIDGTIGLSAARVGDYVGQPPNPIILNTISNIDSVRVRFSLSESEYLELARRMTEGTGEAVKPTQRDLQLVLADGSVYPLKGRALFAERRIDPATGTLLIEASFPNPQRMIRPGQFARVRTIFDERKGAVVVPVRALSEIQGQFVLFVVDAENKVQFRRVVTGPKSGQLQVIDRGVALGDKVIVEGFQRVRPDMVVTSQLVPYPADSTATPGAAGKGR